MRAWEDLTNVQFPMLNSHPKGEAAACVRSCPASVEHLAIRHPLRMRIEHWELSIGQIPGRIQGSGFCQVIFARALSGHLRPLLFQLTASCGNIIAAVLPNEGGDVVVDKDLLELFHRSV